MPDWMRSESWRRYLRFWGANPARDLDAELDFHIATRTDELIAQGMGSERARATALAEFGDVGRVRRVVRGIDERRVRHLQVREWLLDIWGDVRYALRSLRRAPGFVVAIVTTLTLGIGLNGTIFSLVNAYLIRPLSLPRAERLVVMGSLDPGIGVPAEMSYPDFEDYRALRTVFSDLAGTVTTTVGLNEEGRTERVWAERTTGNYFQTLRPTMLLGRAYTEDESGRGLRVIVLSHSYWQRKFSGDSAIIGRTIRLDGEGYQVLGVTAHGFRGFAPFLASEGWMPLDESPAGRAARLNNRASPLLYVVGVLAPGANIARAREAVAARAALIRRDHAATSKNIDAIVVPETRARPMLAISQPLPLVSAVLLGLTLLVLVIACANVANLLLARGTVHQREHAIRAALGAKRWRLARQALIEVALLSLAGALGAFLLALWATGRLSGIRVALDAPVVFDIPADWRVFVFTLVAAVATTLLAGLLPALRNAAVPPHSVLAGGRVASGRRQHRLRGALVVAQIAVSVLVLVAAGLFARSMVAAQRIELGFRTNNVLTATFDLSMVRYDSIRSLAFQRELLKRARRLPGVEAAVLAAGIPFGYNNSTWRVSVDDPAVDLPESGLTIFDNVVSPEYFRVAGPELLRGRAFVEADDASAPRVAVINEAMARRLWPNTDAMGKRFRTLENRAEYRVVGVARDAKWLFLSETPRPFFWRPLSQAPRDALIIELATARDAAALEQPLRAIVHDLEPDLPLYDVRTMEEHLRNGRAFMSVRYGARFGVAFALLALALAAVGVYGVVSYAVSNRTREIGIRIALGARMATVTRLVVRQGLVLAAIGVVLGTALALSATRVMATLLYGVRPSDPVAFGGALLVLVSVTAIASWVPARRASRLDPVRALREE